MKSPPTQPTAPASESDAVEVPGLIADRYRDEGRIARGGMGEIRRVYDVRLRRVLGMKLMHRELAGEARARRRFAREAQITATLPHPGVVAVHDFGELDDGRLWYTMPLVKGQTLRDVVERRFGRQSGGDGGWTLRRTVEAFRRVCEVLAYAHQQGIVHRDIKPSNVMLGDFGEVLVMDWGLAKRVGAPEEGRLEIDDWDSSWNGAVREVVGTLAFMAPEQARGEETVGPTSDVYSLGAMLRYVLVGRAPFEGTESAWLCGERVRPRPLAELPPPDGEVLPELLCRLCDRALSEAPEDRPAHAGILAQEIALWLDGEDRRREAARRVAEADELEPRVREMRARAYALRDEASAILRELGPSANPEEMIPAWRLEDAAAALEREAIGVEVAWQSRLWSALHLDPALEEADARLAAHYGRALTEAELDGDEREVARLEALLRVHGKKPSARQGTFTLRTSPSGARVHVSRYEERDRRLVAQPLGWIGETPLERFPLDAGSYLLEIVAAGRSAVRLPILVRRGEHLPVAPPGYPDVIPLPRAEEVPPGFVYVPRGWFVSGGDAAAAESLPRRVLFTEGLLVAEHPVTVGEYVAYLDELVARGREEEALRRCPRVPLGAGAEEWSPPALGRAPDGRFTLPVDETGIPWEADWPVTLVSWHDAIAYCEYRARRDGLPFRLLNELEWERVARGADGRVCAFGRQIEPAWACIVGDGSRTPSRAPVTAFPVDTSPFGVRHTTGNVREWCANRWTWHGPAVRGQVVQRDEASADDDSLRAARGGCWYASAQLARAACRFAAAPSQRFGGLGFRLACDFPFDAGTKNRAFS